MGNSKAFIIGVLLSACAADTARAGDALTGGELDAREKYGDARLTEVKLFGRCYTHLTRKAVPPSHALLAQVKAGTLNGIDACIQILDGVQFDSNGVISNHNAERQLVLNTFQALHQTWWSVSEFNTVLSPDVLDMSHNALFVTRALFGQNVRYDSILTSNFDVEAIRTAGVPPNNVGPISNYPAIKSDGWITYGYTDGTTKTPAGDLQRFPMDPMFVQLGELRGVAPMSTAKQDKWALVAIGHGGGLPAPKVYYNKTQGGGILGSQTFLTQNFGRSKEMQNGGLQMPRRWSKAVMNDLLCRDLPALRTSDVQSFVRTNSALGFRNGATCMSCHSTMDPMSGVLRRGVLGALHDLPLYTPFDSANPQDRPAESQDLKTIASIDSDGEYYRRPPRGHLFYRSYDGTLVDTELNNLADLGAKLAATNDPYVCAAKRYFEYFTGIRANLQDTGDLNKEPLSTADQYYRQIVVTLGLRLKQSQNLKSLIKDIFRKPVYQKSSQREMFVETQGAGNE